MSLKDEFPGYKVVKVSQGFRVQCRTCYVARKSGASHPHVVVPTIPAIRVWVDGHEHGLATIDEARAECRRMARERRQGLDEIMRPSESGP